MVSNSRNGQLPEFRGERSIKFLSELNVTIESSLSQIADGLMWLNAHIEVNTLICDYF